MTQVHFTKVLDAISAQPTTCSTYDTLRLCFHRQLSPRSTRSPSYFRAFPSFLCLATKDARRKRITGS
ncbi:hypothetical protein BDN71DRAFT_1449578 [Pleurotus eryngii]|uniref:Uncharacterized protein n=1 Tax=Pleurotus eryngii TaxID=5323 RepID=A0A9P5ZVJ8_PLEER|nr:hypothetical protein BDN71DRAFT_1449578 [Pleurotus eryngii]